MPDGLLLSDDLLFSSRVTATARAHGLTVAVARTPAALLGFVAQKLPKGVLLDLQCPDLDLAALVGELSMLEPVPKLTGYGSHVDAQTLKEARALGIEAMPRSQFAERVEAELAGWLGSNG